MALFSSILQSAHAAQPREKECGSKKEYLTPSPSRSLRGRRSCPPHGIAQLGFSGLAFKVFPTALVFLCVLPSPAARAHWISPDEIIAGFRQNKVLQQQIGIAEAYRDPGLPRLLIIKVHRDRWESVPAAERIKLAEDWLETWHHNVDQGILGILDAATSESVVNFDADGNARLVERPRKTPTK